MSTPTRKPFLSDEKFYEAVDFGGGELEYVISRPEIRELYEAHLAEQEQTIADLRARVEAMQKAGGAMRDKLAQLRMRQYQMMSQWAEASEEKKKELWSRLHERTDQYLDAIETWDAACSVTTNIAEHVRVKVPVVTHINMDPNASAETKQAVGDMIRAAYDYKPSAPAQPLSVDKVKLQNPGFWEAIERKMGEGEMVRVEILGVPGQPMETRTTNADGPVQTTTWIKSSMYR